MRLAIFAAIPCRRCEGSCRGRSDTAQRTLPAGASNIKSTKKRVCLVLRSPGARVAMHPTFDDLVKHCLPSLLEVLNTKGRNTHSDLTGDGRPDHPQPLQRLPHGCCRSRAVRRRVLFCQSPRTCSCCITTCTSCRRMTSSSARISVPPCSSLQGRRGVPLGGCDGTSQPARQRPCRPAHLISAFASGTRTTVTSSPATLSCPTEVQVNPAACWAGGGVRTDRTVGGA